MPARIFSGWIVMDIHGRPQGLDTASGGYPYVAEAISSIHFWQTKTACEEYVRTINYGNKGYWAARVILKIIDE